MKTNEKTIRNLVKNIMNEIDLSESDIISKDDQHWEESKEEFKTITSNLLNNIQDDKYEDANGEIEKAIKVLKTWKKRITKELTDSKRS